MPFYDYQCSECSHLWEDFHSMSTKRTNCENCNSTNIKRLIPSNISVKVVLGPKEAKASVKLEQNKLREQIKTDEKLRASLVGEQKYNDIVSTKEEVAKNLKNI